MKKLFSLGMTVLLIMGVLLTSCANGASTVSDSGSQLEASASAESASVSSQAMKHSETTQAVSTEAKSADTSTRTITDHAGHQVELPAKLDRIVIGSLTPLVSVYTMFTGSADGLVGIHEDSRHSVEHSIMNKIEPALANLPSSFSTSGTDTINIEELLKLKPQVYFYNADVKDNYEILKSAGIPAVGFSTTLFDDYSTIDTFNAWVDLLAEVLDKNDKSPGIKAYGEKTLMLVKDRLKDLKEEDKPKALILANYNNNAMMAGGTSFANYWIATAGGTNLGNDVNAFVAPVNMEQIYAWNPDVLYINSFSPYTVEQLMNNEVRSEDDWSGIAAVKASRVYKIPKGTYYWYPPSSDAALNLLFMGKTMHPARFEDINLEEEIKKYYKAQFAFELSDEDVKAILNPTEGF